MTECTHLRIALSKERKRHADGSGWAARCCECGGELIAVYDLFGTYHALADDPGVATSTVDETLGFIDLKALQERLLR